MRLTVPEIDCSQGFTLENDIFERRKFSIQLEKLIDICEDESLVIALNDKWGNGKTTFLKMWEAQIKREDKFKVVYFDAFKNDFQADPFVAISSHIYSIIEEEELKKQYIEVTKKLAKVLLKTSLKVGVSALTLGVLKGTELENLGDEFKSSINDPLGDYIEEKLTKLDNEIRTLDSFKSTLSEIGKGKKLIFIIDELDRARPSYSLELLERVKHVFNTENIFFILSVEKEQFKKIIKKTYGEIDADLYLNKFIHLWYRLPQIDDQSRQVYTLEKYISYINKRLLTRKLDLKHSLESLSYLLRVNKFTLRDAERCYSMLLLCNANMENGYRWEYQIGVAIVTFLYLKDQSLITRIKENEITKEELVTELGIIAGINDENFHIYLALNTEFMTKDQFRAARTDAEQTIFDDMRQLKTISEAAKTITNLEFK